MWSSAGRDRKCPRTPWLPTPPLMPANSRTTMKREGQRRAGHCVGYFVARRLGRKYYQLTYPGTDPSSGCFIGVTVWCTLILSFEAAVRGSGSSWMLLRCAGGSEQPRWPAGGVPAKPSGVSLCPLATLVFIGCSSRSS